MEVRLAKENNASGLVPILILLSYYHLPLLSSSCYRFSLSALVSFWEHHQSLLVYHYYPSLAWKSLHDTLLPLCCRCSLPPKMKPSWLVPVLSTACASTLDVEGSFMHLCSDISLHPNTGVLSASCNLGSSDAVPVNTSVDLNGCLGWGPSLEPEPIKYSENEIYPSVK